MRLVCLLAGVAAGLWGCGGDSQGAEVDCRGRPLSMAEHVTRVGSKTLRFAIYDDTFYWSDYDTSTLVRMPFGGEPAPVPGARALWDVAADPAGLYWLDGEQVMHADHQGEGERVLGGASTHMGSRPWIAPTEDYVYWVWNASRLAGIARSDRQEAYGEERIAEYEGRVAGLAVDATHVYWSVNGDLVRREKASGEVEMLALSLGDPDASATLALDDQYAYFSDGQDIHRVPKSGGTEELVADAYGVRGLAVDDGVVYWTANGSFSCSAVDGSVKTSLRGTSSHDRPVLYGDFVYWVASESESQDIFRWPR